MTLKNVRTAAILLLALKIHAQKFEQKEVTIADLEQKNHPLDTSAGAAILFQVGDCNITFLGNGFQTKHEVKTRIKIYNKQGYDWAIQSVYFPSGRSGASVSFNDVATYNLVDGKIIKTPLKRDGAFEDKVTKYLSAKKIQLPSVKEGSILEFSYTINMMGIGTPPKWSFQNKIPVDYSEFTTHIPEYLIFNTNQKGYLFPTVTQKKLERSGNYQETLTNYKSVNMPALKAEAYVTNIDNYTSGISHELAAYRLPSRYSMYSGKVASDWNAVAKNLYEYVDFGDELKKTGYFEKDVDSVVKGLSSRSEIINAVYNLARSKVKWNNRRGFVCEEGLKAACKNKTGNVADVNLLLTAMLRYVELDANPVLVSTRNNGIVFFPSIDAFDYVIAGVQTQTGFILLDATEEFAQPDLLPTRDLNWFGRLVRDNGTSEQIDLIPTIISKEISYMSANIKPDGTIEGKIKKQYTDYEALDFREKNKDVPENTFLEGLEAKCDNAIIEAYRRENEKDLSKVLAESYNFKDTHAIEIINDKLYVSPLLFLRLKENPFKQEKREYPVDFGYPTQKRINATLQIPEGYAVEFMPEGMSMETENDIGSFKYALAAQDSNIQVTAILETKMALVSVDYYSLLKEFYQSIVDKQNEKIILKKI